MFVSLNIIFYFINTLLLQFTFA